MPRSSNAKSGGSLGGSPRRCVEEVEARIGPAPPSCPRVDCPSSSRNGGPSPFERRPASKVGGHRQGTVSTTTTPKQLQQRRSSKGSIKKVYADESNLRDLVFQYTSKPPSPAPTDVVMEPSNPLAPHSHSTFPIPRCVSPLTPLSNSSISTWGSPSEPAGVSRSQPVSPKTHVSHNPTRPFTSQPTSPLSQSTASPWSPLNAESFSSFHLNSSAETSPQNPHHTSHNEAHYHSYFTSGTYALHGHHYTETPTVAAACLSESQTTTKPAP